MLFSKSVRQPLRATWHRTRAARNAWGEPRAVLPTKACCARGEQHTAGWEVRPPAEEHASISAPCHHLVPRAMRPVAAKTKEQA